MFINQKSQEISYALVRISPYIRRQELRSRIERLAFQLLEEASSDNFESAIKTVASLESLISLGKSIYEVEPINAKIIIGELKSLGFSIREKIGLDALDREESPDLEGIFSKVPAVVLDKQEFGNAASDSANQPEEAVSGSSNSNSNGNGLASAIRQSAILEKIRQSESRKAPLKEVLAAFPEVSERTMRYDLQKLCGQGLIERVGSGGPGSYYTIK